MGELLLELFDSDVLPGGGEGAFVFSDAVNLEADAAFGVAFEDLLVAEI